MASMNLQQAMAKIAELEAQKAALQAASERKLRLEISKAKPAEGKEGEKGYKPATKGGGLKLIGIRYPFPVTFYANEWLRILDFGDEIRKFIEAHKDELTFGKNGQ